MGQNNKRTDEFDVAIIGAGHNGLVCANYLARAGLKVTVLEARYTVGGACVSEKVGDATWSSCAFLQGMLRPEIIEDLELAKHGLVSRSPEAQGMALWEDGDHIMFWQDLDKTLASIDKHRPGDAQKFMKFASRFKRYGDLTRDLLLSEPPSRSEFLKIFESAGEEELLHDFVLCSAADLVKKYVDSDRLQAYMMFLGMVSTWGGPSTPGTAYVYGYHALGEYDGVIGRMAAPVGGMGAITQALAKAAAAHGVVVRTDAPVASVAVKSGAATGVVLESGEEISARIVISGAAPQRSLGQFLHAKWVPEPVRRATENIDHRGSMARIHLLVDELPRYVGFDSAEVGPEHCGHVILGATEALYEQAWDAQRRGQLLDNYVIEAFIHSVTDPSVCATGHHTITLGVQQLPFELSEGDWDSRKEAWADAVVKTFCKFAPNIAEHIVARHIITPLDLEREWGLIGGNIFQGSIVGLDQQFEARPIPGYGHYRTPVENYYMCGAGTHPGGGVTGAPGHNAAMRVLADVRGEHGVRQERKRNSGNSLVNDLLDTRFGQLLGYQVAKSRGLRAITRHFSKAKR